MSSIKNILAAVGAIVLLLAAFKLIQVYYEDKIEDLHREVRNTKIRTATLERVAKDRYRKIVADNETIDYLEHLVDSLEIEVKNPKLVERFEVKPEDKDHSIEELSNEDSIIEFVDYYPQKENAFLKYYAKLNLNTKSYSGRFVFRPIQMAVVVGEEDGLYSSHIKVPEFLEVKKYDLTSTKLGVPKPDNFGWLAGIGYFNKIDSQKKGIEFTAGLRYKKVYLLGSAYTNSTVGIKTLIEF